MHYLRLSEAHNELSSAGMAIANLEPFHSITTSSNDWIIIPGLESKWLFNDEFEQQNQEFFSWLRIQEEIGCRIASVCTGAYLLAQAGILNNRECTTHWKYLKNFKLRFPLVKVHEDRLFIKDDTIYSSAGVASGIDLALYLLEEEFGSVFASIIAKEVVVYLRRTANDPQLSIFLQFRNHIESRVHEAQDYLAQNIDSKVRIEELAEVVHMSPRNLTRLFKKVTGITIGLYINKLRAERAMHLLEQGNKLEMVSQSCGLNSVNQLRHVMDTKSKEKELLNEAGFFGKGIKFKIVLILHIPVLFYAPSSC